MTLDIRMYELLFTGELTLVSSFGKNNLGFVKIGL